MSNNDAARALANLLKYYEGAMRTMSEKELADELLALGLDPAKVGAEMQFAVNTAVDRYYAARTNAQRECSGQQVPGANWPTATPTDESCSRDPDPSIPRPLPD